MTRTRRAVRTIECVNVLRWLCRTRISWPQYRIERWPLFGMFYCIMSMEFQSGQRVSGRISEVFAIGNVRYERSHCSLKP